ncbi:MAG: hypothetical protein ACR2FV_03730 [Ornithinimicrobium sp.]|uniref:hypothetical protein n=1 Tax=Ornithinimicrobium sp. TaxID=1977084 RepID=UPI003D9BAC4A
MSVLALLLLAVGTADAVRSRAWGDRQREHLVTILAGLSVLALGAVLAGLTAPADVGLLVLAALVLAGWVLASAEGVVRERGAAPPLAVIGLGTGLLVLASGWASPTAGSVARWLEWSALPDVPDLDPDRAMLLAGLLLVQFATGNVVVRLVLIQVGALPRQGTPQAADRLRGGRLLGPMERVIILGLGLAGEVTAASLVIAAKGLIRWPELRSSDLEDSAVGVDEVTEYFLVGSMVSWLVALTALAVALLG